MTRQEMFDKAVRGLRSQGYYKCVEPDGGRCVYTDEEGRHCAWGWVDPTAYGTAAVGSLHCGLAPRLSPADRNFASELQIAHDKSADPKHMEQRLRALAAGYFLTWPEEG